MSLLPELNKEEKAALKKVSDYDRDKLKEWELKLTEATEQVAYWKRQFDHSSTLALRVTLSE